MKTVILFMTFWPINDRPFIAWISVRSPAHCITIAAGAVLNSRLDGIPRMSYLCRTIKPRVPAACRLTEPSCS